jgi:CBS domain-containing protein
MFHWQIEKKGWLSQSAKKIYNIPDHMPLVRARTLVRDLMQVGVVTCPPETVLLDAARLMLENQLDTIVVLSQEDGNALGVVNQEDLINAYVREDMQSLKVSDIMHEDLPQVPPDIPIKAAVQMMLDQNVRTCFLTHHAGGIRYPAASLSFQHVLKHMAAQNEEDLRGLGIEAERQTPIDVFIQKRDAARRHAQSRKKE